MIRALIADDEPLAREGIRARLADQADIDVVGEAADGVEAVQAIENLSPDLLFLDVQMPGIDGFEVLRRLRAAVPAVVLVTAYDRHAVKAFEAQALDREAMAVDLLRHRMPRALRRKPLRREHQQPERAACQLARLIVVDDDDGRAGC